jgi:hypothetical protein
LLTCLLGCALEGCAASNNGSGAPQSNGSAGMAALLPIGVASAGTGGGAGGVVAPAGGAAGSVPLAGMAALPAGGTGGSAAAGAGGMGGGGGLGGTGGVGGGPSTTPLPSNSPDCPDGFRCQSLGAQSVCVASNNLPPSCTMIGDPACGALTGSMCTMSTAGMQCVKPCTVAGAMPAGCPTGLMCVQSVVGTPFCGTAGALVAPACTIGGTECQQYKLQCVDVGFGPGCWTTCTL